MTDYLLAVSSADLEKGLKRSTTDFTVNLQPAIRLETLDWNISLLKLSTFYAVYNIDQAKYNNASFEIYEVATNTWTSITVLDGLYSFEDYYDRIVSAVVPFYYPSMPVSLTVNRNTGKFRLNCPPGFKVSLSKTLAVMLGFYDKSLITTVPWWSNTEVGLLYEENTTTFSTFIPEWNMGIVSLNLECDLVTNSVSNGKSRSVLASFQPRVGAFEAIEYEPKNLAYLQVRSQDIKSLTFRLTDDQGYVVNNRDEMTILLKLSPFNTR